MAFCVGEVVVLKASGSKAIVVDEVGYRYVISEDGRVDGDRVGLVVTVQGVEGNGARLRVGRIWVRRVAEEESKYYMGRTVERPVGPGRVAGWIREAVGRGWKAGEGGRVFEMAGGEA